MKYLFKNAGEEWAKRSFSQSGEDLIVRFIFDLIGIKTPTYMDIGAHHPFYLNNTAILYETGSHGVNIEPNPQLYPAFLKSRKNDVNLNYGVGTKSGELMFNILNPPTLSTFSDEEADKMVKEHKFKVIKRVPVKIETIENIVKEHLGGRFPDFLNIDAEGLDEIIIKSIEFNMGKPVVICLETISYSEKGDGVKNTSVIEFLNSLGYMVFADTYINTIFVLKEKWLKK
jgi:FkbM family methyltransferase